VSIAQSEFERLSFVIKLWLEEAGTASSQKKWRGHITNVGTGERRYVESLQQISSFIQAYLAGMKRDRIRRRIPDVEEERRSELKDEWRQQHQPWIR